MTEEKGRVGRVGGEERKEEKRESKRERKKINFPRPRLFYWRSKRSARRRGHIFL